MWDLSALYSNLSFVLFNTFIYSIAYNIIYIHISIESLIEQAELVNL